MEEGNGNYSYGIAKQVRTKRTLFSLGMGKWNETMIYPQEAQNKAETQADSCESQQSMEVALRMALLILLYTS